MSIHPFLADCVIHTGVEHRSLLGYLAEVHSQDKYALLEKLMGFLHLSYGGSINCD